MKRSTVKTCLMTAFTAAAIAVVASPGGYAFHKANERDKAAKETLRQNVSSVACFNAVAAGKNAEAARQCTLQDTGAIDKYLDTVKPDTDKAKKRFIEAASSRTCAYALIENDKDLTRAMKVCTPKDIEAFSSYQEIRKEVRYREDFLPCALIVSTLLLLVATALSGVKLDDKLSNWVENEPQPLTPPDPTQTPSPTVSGTPDPSSALDRDILAPKPLDFNKKGRTP